MDKRKFALSKERIEKYKMRLKTRLYLFNEDFARDIFLLTNDREKANKVESITTLLLAIIEDSNADNGTGTNAE